MSEVAKYALFQGPAFSNPTSNLVIPELDGFLRGKPLCRHLEFRKCLPPNGHLLSRFVSLCASDARVQCCHCTLRAPPRVTDSGHPSVNLHLCVRVRHILIALRYLCVKSYASPREEDEMIAGVCQRNMPGITTIRGEWRKSFTTCLHASTATPPPIIFFPLLYPTQAKERRTNK